MARAFAAVAFVIAVSACGSGAAPEPPQSSPSVAQLRPASIAPTEPPAANDADLLCRAVRSLQQAHDEHASKLAGMLGDWMVLGPDGKITPAEKATAAAHAKAVADVVAQYGASVDGLTSPDFPEILVATRQAYGGYASGLVGIKPWIDNPRPGYPGDDLAGALDQLVGGRKALDEAIAGVDLADAAGRMSCRGSGADLPVATSPVAIATASPRPTPTPTPTPTATPKQAYSPYSSTSRTSPVPLHQAHYVGDWLISVAAVDTNAWPELEAENMFNEPPAKGSTLVMVAIKATYNGSDSGSLGFGISQGAVGATNVGFKSKSEVLPNDCFKVGDVFPGGTVTCNLAVFEVPKGEVESLVMYLSALLDFSGTDVYYALR